MKVPLVRQFGVPEESLSAFEHDLYQAQEALPAAEVDHMLLESERRFLGREQFFDSAGDALAADSDEDMFEGDRAPSGKRSSTTT